MQKDEPFAPDRVSMAPKIREDAMRLVPLCFAMLLPIPALLGPALARPVDYVLQAEASQVGFALDFGKDQITGQMPVTLADLTIDFDSLANCRFDVALDVTGTTASFPFAEQALKGPKVLDAASFPGITFRSTAVRAEGDGAAVEGLITIRGVEKPITLTATIFRQQGTAEGDRSLLTVHLVGAVNRSDFGATGWSDMVGDQVRLDILARIERVGG